MTLEKKDILSESPKSQFLETPKFIEGFGSYYPEALECDGEKYIIYSKPNELFYKNGKYFVEVVKLAKGLKYGDGREYSYMIFDNGKIKPFTYGISVNNRAEMNKKHPIIETNKGYMKYDENLNCSVLEGMPKGYFPTRWDRDNGTIQLETKQEGKNHMIYSIDQDYKVKPIGGVPEGMYISEIKDTIATIAYPGKQEGKTEYNRYFYNQKTKQIESFTFKGLEGISYKVDAYNTEKNVISVTTTEGKTIYFYFAGKSQIEEVVTSLVEGKIYELNKDSQTARMYDRKGDEREEFCFYNNGIVKPFTGLAAGEKLEYSDTYQFINEHSKVKAMVVKYGDYKKECRTYDQQGVIKPFEGLKEGWKPGDRIRQSVHGKYFFLPIKIKGFADETHTLLSKDSQKIVLYKDMLIGGINPKKRQITVVTQAGPDCDIVLNKKERNNLMREWDPNYKETKSVKGVVEETSAQVSENIQ